MTKEQILQTASRETRRLIGDAIDHRRSQPLVWFLYHSRRATDFRLRGKRVRALFHRAMRRRYKAKAQAVLDAADCREDLECLG